MPGQIKVDPPPQQVGNSRNSTGRSEDWIVIAPDAPSRKIALVDGMVLSAEDDQETSNQSDNQRSQ